MNKIFKAGIFSLAACTLVACDDVFEPLPENNLPIDFMVQNSTYAENTIGNVYAYMPLFDVNNINDVATDDAVHNVSNNSWRIIAGGQWTAQNNPTNRWEVCRNCIQYCNLLLSVIDEVQWVKDEEANACFRDRFYGETHALRGMLTYLLLQAHAGQDASGQLLGIPIVTVFEDGSSDFNVPRNTFRECYDAMMEDFRIGLEYLPNEFHNYDSYNDPAALDELRKRYPNITESVANRVFGLKFCGRMSGQIVKAFMSRAALMAASPAFEQSGITWQDAADAAADVLKDINGISGLDPKGLTWYADKDMVKLQDGVCPPEVIWRSKKGENCTVERNNYPPSLYGSGQVNPSQNLVDAFPMANGYPITDLANSGYDPQNPYAGRDPRLETYIIYNGSKAGINDKTINTAADSPTNDGLEMISSSTRTGYYMRKHLRMDAGPTASKDNNQFHYTARIRFTEIFLNYAEAMNEAQGPKAVGKAGCSAYDVIKAIRNRAGITDTSYLDECAQSKEKMRELIRNERRLELCFEGFRFYDLRRWKADLNVTARGMRIENGTYTPFDVETRNYKDYMIYGPIPYSETLKFSNLQQNYGW